MDHSVAFDRFRFDPESGRLFDDAQEVRLTPKAAALLGELVTRAGEPVSKQDLFDSVWRGSVVSDDALTSCVQELRRALGDDPKQPRFIETRHRRGYRFIASIRRAPQAAVRPARSPATIAVLPFSDMSPGRDQDFLCEGLAEELILALTHIDGLRVAARTASFQFRDADIDLRGIGRRLGVETLLEGSVRKADEQLRVTVQLVDVATGFHRWSQRFDRKQADLFAIQDEIATSVSTALRGGVLSAREQRGLHSSQTSVAAYEHYLRGRQHLPRMTQPQLQISREMFERALELDPRYGPAWACLATVHATLYEWFGGREADRAQAERHSLRAIELAPGMADAHVARGLALSIARRYTEAAQMFDAAIELNPNSFEAHYYYARSCFACGEIERSARLFAAAAEVQREDFQSPMLQAQSLRMLGRDAEAKPAVQEGLRRAEQMLALNPSDGRALSLGSLALYFDGQVARADEWSRRSLELHPDDAIPLYCRACLQARLGQKDAALDLLERAAARGCGNRDWIEHDSDFENLREEPRFKALLTKLV